ncbi:MAG: hypothetical protein HPY90_07890 [Syntrophothermus sp.]|uniref:hypothetical protein n=1 Tax=Syntrophothermus sp. TaxID=2736299 RepID=UPI0025805503|nr:hypothetical protein [Syntrophothermus sp.]NSW83182.1 hypothetical protein [Syntrophothermus sp.]
MSIREELLKAIEAMSEEDLRAVLDYVRLLQEPEEVEPTEEEREAIARGREEYARGEYMKWRGLKRSCDI